MCSNFAFSSVKIWQLSEGSELRFHKNFAKWQKIVTAHFDSCIVRNHISSVIVDCPTPLSWTKGDQSSNIMA